MGEDPLSFRLLLFNRSLTDFVRWVGWLDISSLELTRTTYVSYQTVVQPLLTEPVLAVFLRRRGAWLADECFISQRSWSHTGTRQSHPCSRRSSPACCPPLTPERGTSTRLVTVRRGERKSCRISGEGIVRKQSSFGKIRCHVGVGHCGERSKRLDHGGNEKRSSRLQMQTALALRSRFQDGV